MELKYTKINEPDPGYWAQGEFLTFSVKVYRLKVTIMGQLNTGTPFRWKRESPKTEKCIFFFSLFVAVNF